ncbi:E3 ubiquitin-protein ligase RNF138-like [Microtus oregoni]|uniref:E3 ubiquitin-protein ligase RNF138-like n=1 Tax=Microtus oregoni TaxID=111838 RepID=UPI001BB0EC6C|nr:E3 ubiquitin-protein ligase RNF138-like [Microtus oregoni]
MAEAESASTPYIEDDFYCPICREVFKIPVRVAACQHVFLNSETTTSENAEAYLEDNTIPSDQPSFHCPLCKANMTRQCLHCNSNHRAHIVPAICPSCLSLLWGDPTQLARNFISHLSERHQFDYGDLMNL